jgi:hypothetical protein
MKDIVIKARISDQQKKCLDDIIQKIEKVIPAGEITISSLLRQAIDDYVKSYYFKEKEKGIQIQIPILNMSNDDLESLFKLLFEMRRISHKSMFVDVDGQFKEGMDAIRLKIVSEYVNNPSLTSTESKDIIFSNRLTNG